jgi:FAD/FMN-containing dehydrogenase
MKQWQKALIAGGAVAGGTALYRRYLQGPSGQAVNDIHAQINPTRVSGIVTPSNLSELLEALSQASREGKTVSIAGGRHAMGGQQFCSGQLLIDTRKLNRVLVFDKERGHIEVEAGMEWPELVDHLINSPVGQDRWWSIAQKQTGADRLTIGGSLSSNVHGRGLRMKPLIGDVESFTLLDAEGSLRLCSRTENPDIFRLAIGGYGLFGIIYSVRLRLVPRQKMERVVEVIGIEDLISSIDQRVEAGFLYGDFQYVTDEQSEDFLRKGVFSCYRPVDMATTMPKKQKSVSTRVWKELVYLGHTQKSRAFELYANYYLTTTGQIYWSDTHQLAAYINDYHSSLDRRLRSVKATEIITEIFVPRAALCDFMNDVRDDFRLHNINLIYGTIRMVERDDESFLAWARESYACVIFNLHTEHTPQGLEHSAQAFRRLIDLAIRYSGGYYLTYHRYATAAQVEACYPQFRDFLAWKKRLDPSEVFQSDWYRHHLKLFADEKACGTP